MIDGASSDHEIVRALVEIKNDFPVDAPSAAKLAIAFADSGDRFWPDPGVTADIASTGGPTSLSTLLCPLFLRVAGCCVVKLGVPGRPAGGIDCLAQLQGYRTALAPSELVVILKQHGLAHFLASDRYAPLDARVFQLRQRYGFQDVATLAAASLLSKKLAVGVRYAGLDVRVGPHGNFGRTWEEARINAAMFVNAANILNIDARPVLTDGSFPYQPYIGRKEALAALWLLFESKANFWLSSHLELCRTIAQTCVPDDGKRLVKQAGVALLKEAFYSNLEAQGTSPGEFERIAETTLESHSETLCARSDGFVGYAMADIRRVVVEAQSSVTTTGNAFPDPLGLTLLRHPGEWVRRGEPIATFRADRTASTEIAEILQDIYTTGTIPVGPGFEAVNPNG